MDSLAALGVLGGFILSGALNRMLRNIIVNIEIPILPLGLLRALCVSVVQYILICEVSCSRLSFRRIHQCGS
jgi:hypothetical protein